MTKEKDYEKMNFLAHVDPKTKRIQYLDEHLEHVCRLADQNCPLEILKHIAQISALLHDAGKLGSFQEYMKEVLEYGEKARRRQIDHASAGARLIETMTQGAFVSKMVGTAIYSHHGWQDCIDMESGKSLSEKRREKEIEFETVQERYFELYSREEILDLMQKAHKDVQKLWKDIQDTVGKYGEKGRYGNCDFFLGMYERLLLSLLIDSDWSDAASFSDQAPLPERISKERMQEIWEEMIQHFEGYMKNCISNKSQSPLNTCRSSIASMCYEAAQTKERRYRLTVPTGAGKTLAGIKFALYHAKKYEKTRIFYIAPFHSILEQNADEIRKAVGSEEYVLEHHCNVVYEDTAKEEVYKKLTENYDVPIVVTTAVQMLNTLFSGQKSSIRRMYSLCNGVILFDEVQALPVRCAELFHLAVNFLTEFCNTTVVLCSATQPSLAEFRENNLLICQEMAGDVRQYQEVFQRVEMEDWTRKIPGGMQVDDLRGLVFDAYQKYGSVLVILNTKRAAREVYDSLRDAVEEDCEFYHLSTNMCPQNREEELETIKKALQGQQKVICVSTQVVEAGVDFSFGCVIRSLAGLDSVIQAAGRCNRHKELGERFGKVYLVKMAAEMEKIDRMMEMRKAQESCGRLLDEFREEPEMFDGALDSQKAIKRYYQLYYQNLGETLMKYPAIGGKTGLVDLLGKNELGIRQYERQHRGAKPKKPLNQAFRTAGEEFEVIPEDEKVSVIVPYDRKAEEELEKLSSECTDISEKKSALRKLQRYTVGISPYLRNELNRAVDGESCPGVLVLNMDYYDRKTGVLENPKIRFLNM